MSDALQDTARILCRYEGGKEWEDASQNERDKWLKAAKEVQDIINAPWPTHLTKRGLH
ncbi:hypothetical protein [Nitratireductor sp. GCM10026969]|uniref:hypothetical protein n=1 Tax=Nitratireductor sp. GCM10026969 TaxID=3252645 RepID=UPI003606BB70